MGSLGVYPPYFAKSVEVADFAWVVDLPVSECVQLVEQKGVAGSSECPGKQKNAPEGAIWTCFRLELNIPQKPVIVQSGYEGQRKYWGRRSISETVGMNWDVSKVGLFAHSG